MIIISTLVILISDRTYFLLSHSADVVSNPEKNFSENSDGKPNTFEDDQSQPIENEPIVNEEWLAFIRMSMQELLNGETDSLKHQNLVRFYITSVLICEKYIQVPHSNLKYFFFKF